MLTIAVRRNQTFAFWVSGDVLRGVPEGCVMAFIFAQDMVKRLRLQQEARRFQLFVELFSKVPCGESLVRCLAEYQPQQMNMVGHEAIDGTASGLAKHRVSQVLTKPSMKEFVEPAASPVFNAIGPTDAGKTAVVLWRQSFQIVMTVFFWHSRPSVKRAGEF